MRQGDDGDREVIVVFRECGVVVAVERTRRGGSAGTRDMAGLLFTIPPEQCGAVPCLRACGGDGGESGDAA
jgi:hypothetical protein